MELFEEQGFDDTTAVQIAERARVTTRTFFRYFADKQDVLFADEDMLRATLVGRLLDTPDVGDPLGAVVHTLAAFDWGSLAPRDALRRRDTVIASTPYLLERELVKQHQMADEFAGVLHQRGVDPEVAGLAAHVGAQVFRAAYRRWLDAGRGADLRAVTDTVMSVLATIAPTDARARPGRIPRAPGRGAS